MPLDIQRIQALCFDVDGTLSDSDDVYASHYAALMRRISLIHGPEQAARRLVMWLESPGNAMMSLSDAIGLDALVIPLINWMYRQLPKRRREFLVVPGVPEMLAKLRQRYPLAVISARDENNTMAFLEQCDLAANFDVVITALSARHTKPYPDPILLAARRMGVPPAACLMIGDTTVDIRAGKAAGAQTVGVLCGFGEEVELRRVGADVILPTTAVVEKVLLGEAP
jgi:N-acetyl-D-muramate 6-phosphate phosphatase